MFSLFSIFASALNEFEKRNVLNICLKYSSINLETYKLEKMKASKLAHDCFSHFTNSQVIIKMKKLNCVACLRYSSFHLFPLNPFLVSQITVTHVSLGRSEMCINDSKWSLPTVTTSNLALSKEHFNLGTH